MKKAMEAVVVRGGTSGTGFPGVPSGTAVFRTRGGVDWIPPTPKFVLRQYTMGQTSEICEWGLSL